MRDVSDWYVTGYGENSTLEKIELQSPDDQPYVLKFPRAFNNKRTNWEDINEILAAEIARSLDLPVVNAEVASYEGKRGCLMKNFRYQYNAEYGETVASLLSSEFGDRYNNLHYSSYSNVERMKKYLDIFQSFSLFPKLKVFFVHMNLFDILIGNQDRHGHNWQVLYNKEGQPFCGPLYDNGASLGWQLSDTELDKILDSKDRMNRYYKRTMLKIGLDNREIPKIKCTTVINHLCTYFRQECISFLRKLEGFPHDKVESYINNFPLISETRKRFLLELINFRKNKIIEKINEMKEI